MTKPSSPSGRRAFRVQCPGVWVRFRSGRLWLTAGIQREKDFDWDCPAARLPRFPAGRSFQDADGVVGERPVGTLEHLNLRKPSRRVDYEQGNYPPRDMTFVCKSDGCFFDLSIGPSLETADIASVKAGRGVAAFEVDGVPEYHNPRSGPLRGCRFRPECMSRRGGLQQQGRAERSVRAHGCAWKTARNSPLASSSSIGPSMS